MRKLIIALTVALALQGLAVPAALGFTLLSTGEPNIGGYGEMNGAIWFAGQFTLDSGATISDIQGYMKRTSGASDALTSWLYSNGSDGKPGSSLSCWLMSVGTTAGWYGSAYELSHHLDAGTYWIAFETTDSYFASRFYFNPPTELGSRAVSIDQGAHWGTTVDYTIAYQVLGQYDNPVPLPPSVWLLASGLLGLAGLRWRSQK